MAQFDVLTKQLESLVVLGSLVRAPLRTSAWVDTVEEAIDVGRLTVLTLVRGGRGTVANMAARWAVKYRVSPR